MTEWQPIETAPKDGTEILLFTTYLADEYYDETFSTVQIGSWDFGHDTVEAIWRRPAGWACVKIGEPTHWMPLPEPPK
jgi:hypothetical protein